MQRAIAVPQQEQVKPAFTVRKLEGEVDKEVYTFHPKEKRLVKKTIRVPAGYEVKFAKGHSLRVDERGLDLIMKGKPEITLVNIDRDEIVGAMPNPMVS